MQSDFLPSGLPLGLSPQAGERRRNPRFDMHFCAFVRALGGPWMISETSDVSAAGAFFVSDRPFLLNALVEYVLTFPPDLTKAPQPLRMRFSGTVLRCERIGEGRGAFGIAVRNTAHRYLTRDEASSFEAMEQNQPARTTTGNLQRKTV
jgi:hypothetical protein